MKLLKALFKIFDFVDRIDKERVRYADSKKAGKIVLVVLEFLAVLLTIGFSFGTFYFIKRGIENPLNYLAGVLFAVFAVYAVLYSVSTSIVYIIVAFSSAKKHRSLRSQMITATVEAIDKEIIKEELEEPVKIEEEKDKKEQTTGKFDVTLGVLHIISLVVLVVGIVVSAII